MPLRRIAHSPRYLFYRKLNFGPILCQVISPGRKCPILGMATRVTDFIVTPFLDLFFCSWSAHCPAVLVVANLFTMISACLLSASYLIPSSVHSTTRSRILMLVWSLFLAQWSADTWLRTCFPHYLPGTTLCRKCTPTLWSHPHELQHECCDCHGWMCTVTPLHYWIEPRLLHELRVPISPSSALHHVSPYIDHHHPWLL